jgi:hypothetical protein
VSFDTSLITEVFPASWEGGRLRLSWASSAAPGSWFQAYMGGKLIKWTQATSCLVPAPRRLVSVDIGVVADGEETADFSLSNGYGTFGFADYPYGVGAFTPISTRATLAWQGFGAAGYRVYAGSGPGQPIDYTKILADVSAIEQGLSTDGYGVGPFGGGGYGVQGGAWSYISDPLDRGVWNFSVVPYDLANNNGSPMTTTVTITAPPRPPEANAAGQRLTYSYDLGTRTVSLQWLPSPG